MFPTLCDLFNLEKPDYLECRSFADVFRGKDHPGDEYIFAEINFHSSYEPVRCIRTKRYKYIRFFDEEYDGLNYSNIDDSPLKKFLREHQPDTYTRQSWPLVSVRPQAVKLLPKPLIGARAGCKYTAYGRRSGKKHISQSQGNDHLIPVGHLDDCQILAGILRCNALYEGYRLVAVTCTNKEGLELTYSFDKDYELLNVRIMTDTETELPSISIIYPYSFLYENEIKELFGVRITGITQDFNDTLYKIPVKTPFGRND
ncbi:NADH-quinone oxidoreductase subunit C [Lachnospiraceae bacterium 54-53]